MNPILLDERLSAAAELAREALTGMERPVAADIGCDHGFLTARLETMPNLTMLASDVSAPSLEKARRLLAARGLSGRATLAVVDEFECHRQTRGRGDDSRHGRGNDSQNRFRGQR